MGRRKERKQKLWVEGKSLPKSHGHPFYEGLSQVLDEHGFDALVDENCAEFYYDTNGHLSLTPTVYFHLFMTGFLEGIDSEHGIARQESDSMTLRSFLGFELTDATLDHSTISQNRQLTDLETHQAVFGRALETLAEESLLRVKTLGIGTTTLESNAAMRSIVQRKNGETYKDFLQCLAKASCIETPTKEDLARLDRHQKGKKTSNDDWENSNGLDARITKVRDGRTHLAHKTEHAVDMEASLVIGVTVQPPDRGDSSSLEQKFEMLDSLLDNPEAAASRSDTPAS